MSKTEKKEVVLDEVISTKGRWPIFVKLFILLIGVSAIGELIGTVSIPVGPGNLVFLPMIFAMLIAVLFTPDALGRVIKPLQKFCGEKEVQLSESIIMYVLLLLGVKLGTAAGPNIMKIITAGPALLLQEFGNLGTMIIGLPIAMLLGMKREAVGATVSICREPTLGLISEIYGINSPEGMVLWVLTW